MITIRDDLVEVQTRTQTALFRQGLLVSLRSAAGEEFLGGEAAGSALQLVYANQPTVDVVGNLAATVTVHRLHDTAVQFRCSGWDADGVVTIGEDEATGDILIEPSAYSSRPGVQACRWRLPGLRPDLEVIGPFFQGARLPQQDPLLRLRWFWPQFWEAGFVLLQGAGSGFWVHCRDDRYRYKALQFDDHGLGFETDAYGPVDASLGAGGLVWRLNVYHGDWQVPATIYRDWWWQAYGLEGQVARRKSWQPDIRFALSWYNGDPAILDAVAAKVDPRQVLLHFSQWRTDAYDENYPTFEASPAAREVIAKGQALGFHFLPHCNAVDMDPTHPAYAYLRDFQYRDVSSRRLHGWGWDPDRGGILGVPSSNHNLHGNRHRKVMIKVHPGLAMWRSILSEEILKAVTAVDTDGVFIDVTLCSHNLHNCLVENTTSSEGMNRLIQQIASLHHGLAVGGEGLNEITAQGLSFAQVHLFRSWHTNTEGLERVQPVPVNDFLFGRLCRSFGYANLAGQDDAQQLRMDLHHALGAIPTVTVRSAAELLTPNAGVAQELQRAG